MSINGLSHITFGVNSFEKSVEFYSTLFACSPKILNPDKDAHFRIGDLWFVLVKDETAKPSVGYTHFAFSVAKKDFNSMQLKLSEMNIESWQKDKTFGDSIYFYDLERNKLEVHSSTFEERFEKG